MTIHTLYPLKLYFKYRASFGLIGAAAILNLASWIWALGHIRPQAEPIFLHYNILFGVDYIGEWWRVFGLPMTGLVILLVNFFLAWCLFEKDKFVSLLANATSAVCQALLLVATALLVFLNI